MKMTLDEFITCYEELGKMPEENIHHILIAAGVNGYTLKKSPIRNAHMAIAATSLPNHSRVVADIFQEAIKRGAETIANRPWVSWNADGYEESEDAVDGWYNMISEMQGHINKTRRTNAEWVIRFSNVGWQNKTGITTLTAPSVEALLDKILPSTELSLEVWKSDPLKDNEWYHLRVTAYHQDSPCGETYFIYKPTLKVYNEIVSGKSVKEALEKAKGIGTSS